MSEPNLNWERIARAETHPLKIKLLEAIARASEPCSPTQLAVAFSQPLGSVSYHVKALYKAGFIEMVKTEPRRGAVEHFYALSPEAVL